MDRGGTARYSVERNTMRNSLEPPPLMTHYRGGLGSGLGVANHYSPTSRYSSSVLSSTRTSAYATSSYSRVTRW